ncbi:MAG: Fic/DOC family protein [Clostridia bacterium]
MYNAINSQYTYKGTDILKNKLNIKDEELLKEYETRIVAFKIATISSAKLPKGYTPERLKFINKYLFEEVYEFAGEYRKENITKENFRFSEFEYIEDNINRIFSSINIEQMKKMTFEKFVEQISYIMTELNVLHPFREGNGRTIRELVREICFDCGYVIDWYEINHDDILRAAKLAVLDEREQIKMLRRSIKKVV